MKRYELLMSTDKKSVLRVLEIVGSRILVIDCLKKTMPVFVDSSALNNYCSMETTTFYEIIGEQPKELETLSPILRKKALERYTVIASALTALSDVKVRSQMIEKSASEHCLSKQTVRSYLCQYLAFQEIGALAPKEVEIVEELTDEQRIMRWSLNKFFYTQHKNSLKTAYTMMLKEKYTDENGQLKSHPSFHQFRYFYRKHRKMESFLISRDGIKSYQRNNRPLLGDGVQQFAPSVGTAFLDGTICDIYLVDDAGRLIGRPVLVAAVDTNTSLCMGYSLLWEGGVYSLQSLMLNILSDKVKLCRSMGIGIDSKQWDVHQLPGVMVTDKGKEFLGQTFEQITELGVTLIELPSFRPELKGSVEKLFDLIQNSYKDVLKGYGVIMPDYQERGAHDYR